jgi:MFS family permease
VSDRPRPLASRAFWVPSAIIFLDEVVYLALIPLLPYYADRFELSKTEAGLMLAAYPLLVLAGSVPGGLLTDRRGARPVLLAGTILLIFASMGFAYADAAWMLWAARAAQGFSAGFTSVAGMAMIADSSHRSQRGSVIALAISLQGASTIVGPVVGGFVAAEFGVRIAMLMPAAFGAAVLLTALPGGMGERVAATRHDLRKALIDPLRGRDVRAAAACMFAAGMWGGAVQTLTPLRLSEAGYSVRDLGALFLGAALLGLVLTPVAGRLADRRGTAPVMLAWSALVTGLLAGLALPLKPVLVAALLVALVPLVRVGGTLAYVRGAEYAPVGAGMGAGFGVTVTAWALGAVVGPLGAGAIADAAGDTPAFLAVAVANVLLTIPMRQGRRRARTPPGPTR